MDLEKIRKQIDKIDDNILSLLAERASLMPDVAQYKLENNIARNQPEREKELISKIIKQSEKYNLNSKYVQNIFKRIIRESHTIQKKIIGK